MIVVGYHPSPDEAPTHSPRNYAWEPLADGVWRCRLPFLDVTVGLVAGSDAVLLIDCGTTLLEAEAIGADVLAISGEAPDHLVLTHHHFDHVLGGGAFPGARIHAAAPVAAALTTGLEGLRRHALRYGASAEDVDAAIAAARPPDDVVTHTTIELGGLRVAVEHPGRGHTDHDLVVVVPACGPGRPAVVFCGDLVEQSADPAIDADSDLSTWPHTLDRLLGLGGDDAIYVPGHGAVVDAAFVRRQRDWLARRA